MTTQTRTNTTPKDYDFSGWVTKNDTQCSDGVIIRQGAFLENDQKKVPLVWQHNHADIDNVLGHVILHSRDKGVYGYGFFNSSDKAQTAKELVQHGDISAMSIAANKVKRKNGRDVVHGNIYEVSLVLAGANPGALIDSVIKHSDEGEDEESAVIFTDNIIHSALNPDDLDDEEIEHAEEEETNEDGLESLIKDISETFTDEELEHIGNYAMSLAPKGTKKEDLINVLTEEQLEQVYDHIQQMLNDDSDEEEEEEEEVKQNVFSTQKPEETLTHADLAADILADAESCGSLRQSFANHKDEMLEHGIETIDDLLTVEVTTGAPGFIRPEEPSMVDKILSSVNTTPRHTVRGRWADITTEEARARGYIKGNEKVEEKFSTWNRETYPQTVYKKQSLDNDDIIDITDFDIVIWLRGEMREMLRYELARAVFLDDGRISSSADKIKTDKIRPIVEDEDEFVTTINSVTAETFIETVLKNKPLHYKGTGQPSLYMDESLLVEIQLLKGTDNRYLFGDILSRQALAAKLGVKEIVTPEFMSGKGIAVMVNLKDYEMACPAKGKAKTYEDFDIDFNKHKYLIETRVAGALNTPKSAIVFDKAAAE